MSQEDGGEGEEADQEDEETATRQLDVRQRAPAAMVPLLLWLLLLLLLVKRLGASVLADATDVRRMPGWSVAAAAADAGNRLRGPGDGRSRQGRVDGVADHAVRGGRLLGFLLRVGVRMHDDERMMMMSISGL